MWVNYKFLFRPEIHFRSHHPPRAFPNDLPDNRTVGLLRKAPDPKLYHRGVSAIDLLRCKTIVGLNIEPTNFLSLKSGLWELYRVRGIAKLKRYGAPYTRNALRRPRLVYTNTLIAAKEEPRKWKFRYAICKMGGFPRACAISFFDKNMPRRWRRNFRYTCKMMRPKLGRSKKFIRAKGAREAFLGRKLHRLF